MKSSLVIAILMSILLCQCGSKGSYTKKLETALSQLNQEEPMKDAQRNYAKGNSKYAACLGEAPGPYFPSVPQSDWERIRETKDYWMIQGTSDALESRYHQRLNTKAVRYAEKYNESILKLRAKSMKPMKMPNKSQ